MAGVRFHIRRGPGSEWRCARCEDVIDEKLQLVLLTALRMPWISQFLLFAGCPHLQVTRCTGPKAANAGACEASRAECRRLRLAYLMCIRGRTGVGQLGHEGHGPRLS